VRKPDPFYALGKLAEAVRVLATAPGDVRKRLYDVYGLLIPIRPDDLPPVLRQDFAWVDEMLTKKQSRAPWQGDLLATLRSMRNSTGSKIAERIVHIESFFRAALYDERRRGKRAIALRWRLKQCGLAGWDMLEAEIRRNATRRQRTKRA
jgi:hypothetical protein